MKNKKFQRILSLLVMLALLAAMALTFTACTEEDVPTTDATEESKSDKQPQTPSDAEDQKVEFTVEVTKADGTTKTFTVKSDKENVGDALIAEGLIEGEEGAYGWFITKVDGEYHKWEDDGKYWAFYIDGAYASTGVSSTPITAGATYTFKAE